MMWFISKFCQHEAWIETVSICLYKPLKMTNNTVFPKVVYIIFSSKTFDHENWKQPWHLNVDFFPLMYDRTIHSLYLRDLCLCITTIDFSYFAH